MSYNNRKTISKYWGKCNNDDCHWAHYVFADEDEQDYWLSEHIDEEKKTYWRHYEFMSIPCATCGAYSPLRASDIFCGGKTENVCSKDQIIDYHLDEIWPDNIVIYKENGWVYRFFKKTLSDSLCGQETFRLKRMPTSDELTTNP